MFEAQQPFLVHNLVFAPGHKQATFGTPLTVTQLTYRPPVDPAARASFPRDYHSDITRSGKGHPWPTVRNKVMEDSALAVNGELDAQLAGMLLALVMMKVTTSGVGPFTHDFLFELATRIAPVSTIYCTETADLLYRIPDLALASLTISGGPVGPLTYSAQLIGSGRRTAGSITLPAVAAPSYLYGNDTDILIGAPGAAASIKERVKSWSVTLLSGATQHRGPGGAMNSSFSKIGTQRATVQLAVAAKDVDDIFTLHLNDTLQELQINTNSGASAQLKFKFPNLKFRAPQAAVDDLDTVWNLEAGEQDVLKGAALNLVEPQVINSQAAYLVAA